MTNFDKWHLLNRDSFAPKVYLDWAFYGMIGAALQRRVFFDNADHPLYPNQYIVFIAPAGVGKSMAWKYAVEILNACRKEATVQRSVAEIVAMRKSGRDPYADSYLYPIAADSTSYEALVEQVGNCVDHCVTADGKEYAHSSMVFLLDEVTSIFKQHADDTVTFLLTAWSSTAPYRRILRNGRNSYIDNLCISILGSTTPTEFSKLLRREVVGNGLLSRMILVYAERNRGRDIVIPALDEAQKNAKAELAAYVRGLKNICACARYSQEAYDWLRAYYLDEPRFRTNPHVRLDEYYVRKLAHIQRLSMSIHFAEPGYERPMSLATVQRACDMLNAAELNMHRALSVGGRNELSAIGNQIHSYVARHPAGVSQPDVVRNFIFDANFEEINETLRVLQIQGLIRYEHTTQRYHGITA